MSGNKCWGSPFSDAEIEHASKNGKLLTMELELSRICNLNCIYCYAKSGQALTNELAYAEIIDVLDQGIALGARRIIVLGGGEPLAYPRIMDVLRAIHKRGCEIELFTNGTLLTPKIVDEFLKLKVHPVVKCNSLVPDTQDSLAGKKGSFESIRKGFDLLREAGYPTNELSMGAQTIICQANYAELPHMWRFLRSQKIIPYFEIITEQGRAKEHDTLAVSSDKLQPLFEELSTIDRQEFGIEWEPKPPVAAFSCRRHLFSCTITTVGDVIPCPGVDVPAGNIRTQKLAEILSGSPVFKDLRNIRQTIKGECAECDLSKDCYGCRGMAHHYTGDYLASDPLCWRNKTAPKKLPIAAQEVIPHRNSMLLIDTLTESSNGSGTAETVLPATSIAANPDGTLTRLIHIELMAQAYAAVKGWEILQSGMDFPVGYLVAVQKFEALETSYSGEKLIIDVSTVGEFEGFAIVEGSVSRAGTTIATAKLKLWVPQEEA